MPDEIPKDWYTPSEQRQRANAAHDMRRALRAELERTPKSDEAKRDDLNRQIWELLLAEFSADELAAKKLKSTDDSSPTGSDQNFASAPFRQRNVEIAKLMLQRYSANLENEAMRSEILLQVMGKLGWGPRAHDSAGPAASTG